MVGRNYLHCPIRSILEDRVRAFSSKAKFKLTRYRFLELFRGGDFVDDGLRRGPRIFCS